MRQPSSILIEGGDRAPDRDAYADALADIHESHDVRDGVCAKCGMRDGWPGISRGCHVPVETSEASPRHEILFRHRLGESVATIARALGLSRGAVRACVAGKRDWAKRKTEQTRRRR